jgi:hypothetical protein
VSTGVRELCFLCAGGFAFAGLGLLGFHVLDWLKHGVWASYSTLHLAAWSGGNFTSWAADPSSWIGVHKILAWLPLWAFCWVLSLVVAVVAALQGDQ